MKNKITKQLVLYILVISSTYGQKTKLDTLKMFEGHWVFNLAINTDYTPKELEDTYLKDVRGGKIHIKGGRIFGNFYGSLYENFYFSDKKHINFFYLKRFIGEDFNERDLNELKKQGININQENYGLYYNPPKSIDFLYSSLLLLSKQNYLKVGLDQTMFFLEKDKAEYKYICTIESRIFRDDKSPTLNKILENEEVEILEKGEEYTKIRYWGKALIIGWVKTKDLKDETRHHEYWSIYKENSIKFKVLSTKSFIYDNLFQKTNSYLIKGDPIEVLEENGFYLKIKYNNIIGLIPRIDVEGYNTFRLTKSKIILYSSPNLPTKMYLLKGDDVELLDRNDDWLKIRYYGKKTIDGWIRKSDVE